MRLLLRLGKGSAGAGSFIYPSPPICAHPSSHITGDRKSSFFTVYSDSSGGSGEIDAPIILSQESNPRHTRGRTQSHLRSTCAE